MEVVNPTRRADAFSLTLPVTDSGKRYRLEFKGSLADTNWSSLAAAVGDGFVKSLIDTNATGAQRFYRVRVQNRLSKCSTAVKDSLMQAKGRYLFSFLAYAIGFAVGQANVATAADTPRKPDRPVLYDTKANGTEQIAAALKTAQADQRRIILKFGANW